MKRLLGSWPCLLPAVQPAVAEALNLLMPQLPSLKNEVRIIEPSLENLEDQRVNTGGKCLAQDLMHRNRQVLNKGGHLLPSQTASGFTGEQAQAFIHSFIPRPFTHAFLYHCPVLRALPSGSLSTFRGSSVC